MQSALGISVLASVQDTNVKRGHRCLGQCPRHQYEKKAKVDFFFCVPISLNLVQVWWLKVRR